MNQIKSLLITVCIVLALGVVLGAFGAHALQDYLTEAQKHTWETATRYHFYHGLGSLFILLCALHKPSRYFRLAVRLHLVGILLFSGSLYLLAAQSALGLSLAWLGPVTPVGGVVFIAGWLILIPGIKDKKQDA